MTSIFLFTCALSCIALIRAQTISLGSAGTYGVFAGSNIFSIGVTIVTGNLGTYPGTSIFGFLPQGIYTGFQAPGEARAGDARNDLAAAIQQAITLQCGSDLTGQDLGGMVLTPGVYCFETSASLTGTITLDGQGQSNPLFVFQIGTTFTTAAGSIVTLINGAQACGVFWAVGSSATLNTHSDLAGNILATSAITALVDVSITGGLYALHGEVETLNCLITAVGSCGAPSGPTTTSTTSSTTSTTTSTSSATSSSTTSSSTTTSISTSTTSSKTSTTTSTTTTVCSADNCLRAFTATQPLGHLQTAQAYCNAYTETTSFSSTPTWVPAECTASRISSVCSCIAIPTAPTTSSTTSTTTSSSKSTTTSTTMMVCNTDNCLRAFNASQTPGRLQTVQAYCSAYTKATSYSSTPTWVPAECTASRISSVCSCVASSPVPTTTASI